MASLEQQLAIARQQIAWTSAAPAAGVPLPVSLAAGGMDMAADGRGWQGSKAAAFENPSPAVLEAQMRLARTEHLGMVLGLIY